MNDVPETQDSNGKKLKSNLMSITGQNFGAAIGRSLQLGSNTRSSFFSWDSRDLGFWVTGQNQVPGFLGSAFSSTQNVC
jgi:hypothetical protein